MAKHRTALGKTLDMSALASKNEKVRAVGNMKVNARGDTIDSFGRIIVPATQKVSDKYAKTVGNKSAQTVQKQPAQPPKPAKPTVQEELTLNELEIDESFEEDLEIEQIKQQEKSKK